MDGVKSEDVRLKTEALGLSRLVVELHDSKELKKFVSPMAEAAVGAVGESYLKIKAEALRVCGAITLALDKVRVLCVSVGCSAHSSSRVVRASASLRSFCTRAHSGPFC